MSPINGMDMWPEVEAKELQPPLYKIIPDGPRKVRIRECGEDGARRRRAFSPKYNHQFIFLQRKPKGHKIEPYATQPDATQANATQPDATHVDATQPDATQPDATQPDATKSFFGDL
ncbi:hypothetical protein KIW84_054818 [Lathyrus oleraceus]|uniref:Uncharacterized protein n=1 Tax=Pisum sativum TaxID=3888 RepID=A0A9D4WU60_PEA|nr:hypothetical protein KIW84_054818 [Pisum sativum]